MRSIYNIYENWKNWEKLRNNFVYADGVQLDTKTYI